MSDLIVDEKHRGLVDERGSEIVLATATDATKFVCPGGLVYSQAQELADQIDSAAPNAERLVGICMPDYLARELANQIKAGVPDEQRLIGMQISPQLASAIVSAIRAKRGN